MTLPGVTDYHSHTPGPGRVCSVDLNRVAEVPEAPEGGFWSVGYHPWSLPAQPDVEAMRGRLLEALKRPGVVAVGECGLDVRQGPPLEVQLPVFEMQADVADSAGLSLVVHAVKGWPEILELKARHPGARWMVHGFRGKPELARQLLDAGMWLGFGPRFNPASLALAEARGRSLPESDA